MMNDEIVQFMSENEQVRQLTKELKYELDSIN